MFIQSSCRHFCSTGASGDHSWIIRRLHDLQQKRPIIDLNARSGWNRSWSAWQAGEAAKLLGQCKWQFLCDQIRNICKPYWNMKYVFRTGTQTPINSHGIPWFLSFRICSNYDMFVCFFKNSPLDPFSPSTSKRQSKSVPTIVQTPKCEHTFWPPNPWNADVGVFQIPAVWHYKCETVCCAGVFVMELWEIVVYLEFLIFYLAASPKTTARSSGRSLQNLSNSCSKILWLSLADEKPFNRCFNHHSEKLQFCS